MPVADIPLGESLASGDCHVSTLAEALRCSLVVGSAGLEQNMKTLLCLGLGRKYFIDFIFKIAWSPGFKSNDHPHQKIYWYLRSDNVQHTMKEIIKLC